MKHKILFIVAVFIILSGTVYANDETKVLENIKTVELLNNLNCDTFDLKVLFSNDDITQNIQLSCDRSQILQDTFRCDCINKQQIINEIKQLNNVAIIFSYKTTNIEPNEPVIETVTSIDESNKELIKWIIIILPIIVIIIIIVLIIIKTFSNKQNKIINNVLYKDNYLEEYDNNNQNDIDELENIDTDDIHNLFDEKELNKIMSDEDDKKKYSEE